MEPLLIILVPGLLGGLVLSVILARSGHSRSSTIVRRRLAAPTPMLINMAHIQVEGVGGLGMVAAVVAVALADPRIRLAILFAAALGACLAFVLIAVRRGTGGLPSKGDGPDDGSTLHLHGQRSGTEARRIRGSLDGWNRGTVESFGSLV